MTDYQEILEQVGNMNDVEKFIEECENASPSIETETWVINDMKRLLRLVKLYREALKKYELSPIASYEYDGEFGEAKNVVQRFYAMEALRYTGLETPENVDEGNGV